MKIAVVGKGKTGQAVIDFLSEKNELGSVFDSENQATIEKLDQADAVIVFVHATILDRILPVLCKTKTTVICGTTGFLYSEHLIQRINDSHQTWVVANNFSLSMVLVKNMLHTLGKLQNLMKDTTFELIETHHTSKLDAPSGTAISWQQWLAIENCEIKSIRKEDVKGEHKVIANRPDETVTFEHIAHNRRLFAEGAVWAAKYACQNQKMKGFHVFDKVVKGALL